MPLCVPGKSAITTIEVNSNWQHSPLDQKVGIENSQKERNRAKSLLKLSKSFIEEDDFRLNF